jgi:hypothetical protein
LRGLAPFFGESVPGLRRCSSRPWLRHWQGWIRRSRSPSRPTCSRRSQSGFRSSWPSGRRRSDTSRPRRPPTTSAWMVRNVHRLAPQDGRRWRELRERVLENPRRDEALAELDRFELSSHSLWSRGPQSFSASGHHTAGDRYNDHFLRAWIPTLGATRPSGGSYEQARRAEPGRRGREQKRPCRQSSPPSRHTAAAAILVPFTPSSSATASAA